MSRAGRVASRGLSWLLDYGYVVRHQAAGLLTRQDPADYLQGGSPAAPVLLLPGIYERWQFMRPVADLLHEAGHPVHVLTRLRWNTAPVAASAAHVAAYLREHDLRDVLVVAHSKGGLIGKYAMLHEDPDGRIDRMIAIASPFGGSLYARFLPHPHLRAFSPRDETLRAMAERRGVNARITSVWGAFDPHVPGGSLLPGAVNVPLGTSGHFRILGHPELVAAVARAARGCGPAPGREPRDPPGMRPSGPPPTVGDMDDILSTHPAKDSFDLPELRAAIEAASRCASSCATCADACLHGDHVEHMVRCIDLDNQCAEICRTTADVLSRPGPNGDSWEAIVRACIAVCRECAAECGQHEHDHCQMCARDCTACADACEALLAAAR